MTDILKGYRRPSSATERMQSARTVKQQAVTRDMCWAAIASRVWPARLMPPRIPQQSFPYVLIIDTPAGPISYRVRTDETTLFEHLTVTENDGVLTEDKDAVLLALALNGWE